MVRWTLLCGERYWVGTETREDSASFVMTALFFSASFNHVGCTTSKRDKSSRDLRRVSRFPHTGLPAVGVNCSPGGVCSAAGASWPVGGPPTAVLAKAVDTGRVSQRLRTGEAELLVNTESECGLPDPTLCPVSCETRTGTGTDRAFCTYTTLLCVGFLL